MVDRVGFQVEGLAELQRDLRRLGADTEDLKAANQAIALRGAVLAAGYAPKRSGALAGDIRGNRAVGKAVITAGRRTIQYAGPQNYGWPRFNIKPQLFMQRADEALRPYAVQMYETEINARITQRGLN